VTEVPIEIREYRPGDEHAILRTFHKVFPWARRSLEEWYWQYRDGPVGVHGFVGALPSGAIVSQFTGVPRRVQVGREERVFSEMVDSFCDPDYRQGLKKPGLFGRTLNRYVEHFGRKDRETVMYGLPNPPAYRIGSRFFDYNHFHDVQGLEHDVADRASVPAPPDLGGGSLVEIDAFPPDTDELWARVRVEYDVATIRDRAYLTWRFVDRPNVAYRRYALREHSGRLLALVVLRHDWLREELKARITAVAEWVVDRRHPLTRVLPDCLRGFAHRAGSEKLWFVFRPGSAEWKHCAEVGYHPVATQFVLVGGTYDHAVVPLSRLREGWFFTLGDFDVV
jgi:hypothetical protein